LLPGKTPTAVPEVLEVELIDISMSGAMIKAISSPAALGETITISLAVIFDGTPLQLSLSASICHNSKSGADDLYCIGLAFKGLKQQDKLVLHYLTQTPQT
jgi:hypothetical protein